MKLIDSGKGFEEVTWRIYELSPRRYHVQYNLNYWYLPYSWLYFVLNEGIYGRHILEIWTSPKRVRERTDRLHVAPMPNMYGWGPCYSEVPKMTKETSLASDEAHIQRWLMGASTNDGNWRRNPFFRAAEIKGRGTARLEEWEKLSIRKTQDIIKQCIVRPSKWTNSYNTIVSRNKKAEYDRCYTDDFDRVFGGVE